MPTDFFSYQSDLYRQSEEVELTELDPGLKESILALLEPGEEIYLCSRTIWHLVWAQVVTSRQVVVCEAIFLWDPFYFHRPRIEHPLVRALFLKDITSINESYDKAFRLYRIYVSGEQKECLALAFVDQDKAQHFLSILKYACGKLIGK
jgi:hypothetical protein